MSALSATQLQVLENVAAGRELLAHANGRSAHGGGQQTIFSLRKRGFLDGSELTDKGRAALEAAKRRWNEAMGVRDPSTVDPRERLVSRLEEAVSRYEASGDPDFGKEHRSADLQELMAARKALLQALGLGVPAEADMTPRRGIPAGPYNYRRLGSDYQYRSIDACIRAEAEGMGTFVVERSVDLEPVTVDVTGYGTDTGFAYTVRPTVPEDLP